MKRSMGLFAFLFVQIRKEGLIHLKQPKLIINTCLFFLMILAFLPLTMPANMSLLKAFVPGITWIALLLSMLLASEQLFQQDYEDGVIEQWLISGYPISLFVLSKIGVHWLLNLIPLLLLTPLIGFLYNLNVHEFVALILSLVCGSPGILFLCALAAAFSTGIRQRGMFMALILFPLTIPIMVFGSGSLTAAMQGLYYSGYMAILTAISLICIVFLPIAIASIIRICLID